MDLISCKKKASLRARIFLAVLLAGITACGPLARTERQVPSTVVTESGQITEWLWEYSSTHPEGFTLDIREKETPSEGICVAYAATQDKHSKEDLGYVVSHALAHDGFVGGWWNSEDSLYYFDSVRIFPETDLGEAVSFARENGQLAVFVLSTGEEVRMDTETGTDPKE